MHKNKRKNRTKPAINTNKKRATTNRSTLHRAEHVSDEKQDLFKKDLLQDKINHPNYTDISDYIIQAVRAANKGVLIYKNEKLSSFLKDIIYFTELLQQLSLTQNIDSITHSQKLQAFLILLATSYDNNITPYLGSLKHTIIQSKQAADIIVLSQEVWRCCNIVNIHLPNMSIKEKIYTAFGNSIMLAGLGIIIANTANPALEIPLATGVNFITAGCYLCKAAITRLEKTATKTASNELVKNDMHSSHLGKLLNIKNYSRELIHLMRNINQIKNYQSSRLPQIHNAAVRVQSTIQEIYKGKNLDTKILLRALLHTNKLIYQIGNLFTDSKNLGITLFLTDIINSIHDISKAIKNVDSKIENVAGPDDLIHKLTISFSKNIQPYFNDIDVKYTVQQIKQLSVIANLAHEAFNYAQEINTYKNKMNTTEKIYSVCGSIFMLAGVGMMMTINIQPEAGVSIAIAMLSNKLGYHICSKAIVEHKNNHAKKIQASLDQQHAHLATINAISDLTPDLKSPHDLITKPRLTL